MKHNIIHFYASNNFDKNELDAIREAKKKAISEKYISSYIEEIGTGSSNKTTVFCIPNPEIPGDMLALKIISYVTIPYTNLKFYEAIKALKNDTCKGNRIIQEIQNCLKTQDCRNVIPLSGFDTLIWQCPAYNRVGIDYILKMPLAKCISNAEMLHIMQNSSEEAVCQVNTILKNTPDNIEYLLLLDGLNEVSRKPVYMNGSANISESPVEMITAEIQELLAHQNIRIIITSRSDEYLDEMENSFEKYYLTGIDNNTIYSYLGRNHVPVENIKNNSRLLDTLRVPLFLKLYCQLYSVNEVSTPGEILYTYFSERSTMYTARKRIQEIKKDRTATGMPYTSNIINEKTQWFILDFLLPEIGWYMEKNGLFTIDQQTIKSIIDPILTGTDLTDICGKYGISLFKDYHKGNDGTINVKTYADYLVSLHIDGKSYIQEIIDYCVYSFGILCVNNQHYSFIHQHIRDFFASMKIITNMKLATYIATSSSDNELGRHCLT